MQNETPLFQKAFDFYKFYWQIADHFPKKSRFVLAERIERKIMDLLEIVLRLSYSSREEKIAGLKTASQITDSLKILFRLCFEIKIIDQKKYFSSEEKLIEIGKMIGGWLKSANRL